MSRFKPFKLMICSGIVRVLSAVTLVVVTGLFAFNDAAAREEIAYESSESLPIGSITMELGADIFSAPIHAIFVSPGTDDTWRWYLHANRVSLTGAAALHENSAMSIQLYGSTTSLSILPISFADYARGVFQIQAVSADLASWANYYGTIQSFIQVDTVANFTFSGTIDSSNRGGTFFPAAYTGQPFSGTFNINPALDTAVPEPEIYAMLGLGLGLLGWAVHRRKLQTA